MRRLSLTQTLMSKPVAHQDKPRGGIICIFWPMTLWGCKDSEPRSDSESQGPTSFLLWTWPCSVAELWLYLDLWLTWLPVLIPDGAMSKTIGNSQFTPQLLSLSPFILATPEAENSHIMIHRPYFLASNHFPTVSDDLHWARVKECWFAFFC